MLMKDGLFIFSYGSNLLTERIRRRVGYVESFGRYRLSGYRLVFNKPGADGSAKANLSQTNDPDDECLSHGTHSDALKNNSFSIRNGGYKKPKHPLINSLIKWPGKGVKINSSAAL